MAREVNHITEQRGTTGQDNRSIGELFSDLTKDTTTLVRQEVELAKTEMSHKAARVGKDVGFLAAGGAVAYAGLLTLIAAVVLLLGQAIPVWVSALIVGIVVAGIGGFLVMRGIDNLKSEGVAPTATIETLQEDKEWVQEQTR